MADNPIGRGRGRGTRTRFRTPSPSRPSLSSSSSFSSPSQILSQESHSHSVPSSTFASTRATISEDEGPAKILEAVPPQGQSEPTRRGHHRGTVVKANPHFVSTRPINEDFTKQGNSGKEVGLLVNYFKLKTGAKFNIFLYHLDFMPEQDSKGIRRSIVKQNKEEFGAYIYDGGAQIYAKNNIDGKSFSGTTREGLNVTCTLRMVKIMEPGDYGYMQFFNVILSRCIRAMKLDAVGIKGHFDSEQAIYIKDFGLTLWPGFITSIRNHERDILLCVEVTHKVLRTDNVFKIMEMFKKGSGEYDQKKCEEEILNSIVITAYNKKTYKVKGILWGQRPVDTFEKRGQRISFVDYYNEQHGIKIQIMEQPLLLVDGKRRDPKEGKFVKFETTLLPELCQMTGLTDKMRANFQLMKGLGSHLHQMPSARVNTINEFMNRLQKAQIKEYDTKTNTERTRPLIKDLEDWGLEFDPNLMTCKGRVMDPENINFANGMDNATFKADWTPSFRRRHMISAINMTKWIILVPERDNNNVNNLITTMQKVSMNMQISKPMNIIPVRSPNKAVYMKSLEQAMAEFGSKVEMVFVILPNNNADLYSAVKKLLCVDYGILSQCFLAKNLTNKGLMSICTKVVIQINAKYGGVPWTVKNPMKKLMVVGFDVYHGKVDKSQSLGAFVASTSDDLGSYYSAICIHTSQKEMATQLGAQIQKAIAAYRKRNDCLPERIIMYRDGVGEGQFPEVQDGEVQPMEDALKRFYQEQGAPPPKFTFIVVTKKINTRMIKMQGMSNPDPGTVLDDVVTLPERFDFYMVAQQARQGTVSPTSYNVMKDGCGLGAEKIQKITFKLCHLYFNWSGTVAVPAPCQYAHKLANLVGLAVGKDCNPVLADKLYFL